MNHLVCSSSQSDTATKCTKSRRLLNPITSSSIITNRKYFYFLTTTSTCCKSEVRFIQNCDNFVSTEFYTRLCKSKFQLIKYVLVEMQLNIFIYIAAVGADDFVKICGCQGWGKLLCVAPICMQFSFLFVFCKDGKCFATMHCWLLC